jgi:eukaryotic-like serine/threonine-protein kinase
MPRRLHEAIMPDSLANEQAIFQATRSISTGNERQAYLRGACGSDATLLARVEALLRAHDESRDFLESPLSPFKSRTKNLPPPHSPGAMIGPYKLIEVIGEGGMGVVYRAEQTEPVARQVALKIIKPGMDSREVVARFGAERQSLALMSHPHIAKVLDAGTTESGLPYFAMELVQGVPITDFCDERRLTLRERLELFVQVCRAIQHAHQKGIIHRDIKPSNILIAQHDGQPLPKVIDFGVAKAIGEPLAEHTIHTALSQIIGTPLYMSPEQAEMNAVDVDTRSDVYSLGVVLYELLTGTGPFDKKTLQVAGIDEMRRMIREDEPPRPSARLSTLSAQALSTLSERRGLDVRRLLHSLKGELDWIVMKALEKQRERRYATANDLAGDVVRYLHDLPVVARPSPWWLRLRKWRRRNPIWTVLLAAVAVLLAVLVGGAYWHNERLEASLAVSARWQKEGLAREYVLRRELFANDLQRAAFFRSAGKNAEARQVLQRHSLPRDEADSRRLAWTYLWKVTREPEPERILVGHDAEILTADVSRDGKLLASADRGGLVIIWDVATGGRLHSLQYSNQEVTCVRFSPDGRLLATAGQDRTIRLWDVSSWTETKKLEKHAGTIMCIAWSPDGRRLASSGRDGLVHAWDCATGSVETTLPRHTDIVRCVAWSPDGKWLASADVNQGVLIWDVSDWKRRGSLPFQDSAGNTSGVLAIAFSADSELIAYGGYADQVYVAEVVGQKELVRVPAGHIWSLAFLSARSLIVGTDFECALLHVDRRYSIADWYRRGIGASGKVRAVFPTSEGKLLVSTSEAARTITFWRMEELMGFTCDVHEEQPLTLSPTGQLLASTTGNEHILNVRSTADPTVLTQLRYLRRNGCRAVFSQEGNLLAAPLPTRERPVVVWDTKTWERKRALDYAGEAPTKLAFSYDTKWLAAALRRCVVGSWNLESGQWHEMLPADPTLTDEPDHTAIAFSPVENLLAAARWNDKHITLWRPDQDVVSRQLPGSHTHALAFSPSGQILAAEAEEVISLWEVATGKLLGKILFEDEARQLDVTHLAFSPDGAILAGAATDSTLRLWDLHSHRELVSAQLPGLPDWLQFLPNGQLAVGCLPDTVVWFDAASER